MTPSAQKPSGTPRTDEVSEFGDAKAIRNLARELELQVASLERRLADKEDAIALHGNAAIRYKNRAEDAERRLAGAEEDAQKWRRLAEKLPPDDMSLDPPVL